MSASPLEFWRTGSARTFREPALPKKGPRWWRRITGFYFPAWVPVVAIIMVVFGILGLLFFARSATGAPRIGDHWHARYQFFACGEKQPNAAQWESGVHTHADGIMHIHPFQTFEEGSGARMVKWFEYGGGHISNDEIQIPGSAKVFKNGDKCPDGTEGVLQVFVTTAENATEQKLDDVSKYQPHDGDRIRIVFGPPEQTQQQTDRTVIPESDASRTIDLTVTDNGSEGSAIFDPNSFQVNQGETVKVVITNKGQLSHGFRSAGSDGQYENSDDYVTTPDIFKPGEKGTAVIRLDTTGNSFFRDETSQNSTGTIVVGNAPAATASPTPAPKEAVDVELNVAMGDDFFEPKDLTVPAGKKFRINLTNNGQHVHDLRITGPDLEFDTTDDLKSTPQSEKAGQTGELVGTIDKPGTYPFKCDFHPAQMTGTITVQ